MDECSEKEQNEIKKHIIYGYSAVENGMADPNIKGYYYQSS